MTSFPRRTEKSKIELSPSQKGKNTLSRFSGFKVFLFIFVSAFFWSETSFAVVHSVENISEKVKGDRLSLSDVNSILGTIRGFFFDDSTGFVGVGTDSPASKLEVRDDGNSPSISISNSVNGLVKWSLTHDNNYDLSIGHNAAAGGQELILGTKTNGAESMRIDASGNVGIGTTSPGAKLEVNTDIDITANPDSKGLRLKESHGDWLLSLGVENVTNEGFAIRDVSQGTYPFVIREETGNIGIGTTGPTTRLEVLSGTNTDENFNKALTVGTSTGGGQGGWIGSRTASANQNQGLMLSSSQTLTLHGDNAGDGSSVLDILGGSNPDIPGDTSLLMRVNSDGNVGIGTAEPDAKLEVSGGNAKIHGTESGSWLFIDSPDATSGMQVGFNSVEDANVWVVEEKPLVFGTSNTGRMRIDAEGNVGIGTSSPGAKLEVASTNSSQLTLRNTNTTNGTAGYGNLWADNNGLWLQGHGDTSGEAIILNGNGGNVGIGTTSPDEKLTVDGDIKLRGYGKLHFSNTSDKTYINSPASDTMAFYNTGEEVMRINAAGKVGIGTNDPDEMLEVSGSVKSNGTILTSDSRFKQNIKPISAALEKVSALRGVHFDWKKDQFPEKNFADGTQLGLIAQEVESVFPEVVSTDANGLKSVNYPALIAPLVQSIHTLKLQNEALQSELQEIKNELAGW